MRKLSYMATAVLAVGSFSLIGCGSSSSGGSSSGSGTGASTEAGTGGATGVDGDASVDVGTTGAGEVATMGPIVDLRVDSNRDGLVDITGDTDEMDEDTWGATRGAVFLANIDDDQSACPTEGSDMDLATCNDAADEIVNGEVDLSDIARLRVLAWPDAPADAVGTLTISSPGSGYVRVFMKMLENNPLAWVAMDNANAVIENGHIRKGVELGIEAKDILRTDTWDGYVDITLTVQSGGFTVGTDTVRMRVSPVMTFHHMLPAETVYATAFNYPSSINFRAGLKEAINLAGFAEPLYEMSVPDQWTQDFFETGYMSMPTEGGGQHAIRVGYRSANVSKPNDQANPLRYAGRVVFTMLRGPDWAGVQEFDIAHNGSMDSLNSFGNTETIPPYSLNGVDYPLGRLFRGSVPSFFPDPLFTKMMEVQGQQPPVYVDTSWLLVGHVDETVSFLQSENSERGWTIAANDVALAIEMLESAVADGHGDTLMFVGKEWDTDQPAEISIQQVLDDPDIMADSISAAAEVDAQVGILMQETGITADELIRVPFLHHDNFNYSVAYQPGTVNGISVSPTVFGSPDPHGPVINGKDLFKANLEETLSAYGISVVWVEDWDLYHVLLGEVHCGSNASRAIPDVAWWGTGR